HLPRNLGAIVALPCGCRASRRKSSYRSRSDLGASQNFRTHQRLGLRDRGASEKILQLEFALQGLECPFELVAGAPPERVAARQGRHFMTRSTIPASGSTSSSWALR